MLLALSLIDQEFYGRMVGREIVGMNSRNQKLFGESLTVKALIRHHGDKIKEGHFTVWLRNVEAANSKKNSLADFR